MSAGVVIVGGSYAGLNIALSAREAGYDGPIAIYSDEVELGYQRPPLSKGLLKDAFPEANLPIRPKSVYDAKRIDLHLGRRAVHVDRSNKQVTFEDGARIAYDRLALATGSRPVVPPLPGVELDGVVTLRTLADARHLKAKIATAKSIVLIGGGFIGLEVAASMVQLGLETTVVEAGPRLMARSVSEITSDAILNLHRANGVDIRLGTAVAAFDGDAAGKLTSVRMSTGEVIAADIALLAVGSKPNGELGAAAGLSMRGNAIEVNRFCQTSDPFIVAAGDCTIFQSDYAGGDWVRIESVANATDQGKIAGKALAGVSVPHNAVPWFWSDQYDVKLQIAGIVIGETSSRVLGSPENSKFSVALLDGSKIAAVESINDPVNHLAARKQIGKRLAQTLPDGAARIENSWLEDEHC